MINKLIICILLLFGTCISSAQLTVDNMKLPTIIRYNGQNLMAFSLSQADEMNKELSFKTEKIFRLEKLVDQQREVINESKLLNSSQNGEAKSLEDQLNVYKNKFATQEKMVELANNQAQEYYQLYLGQEKKIKQTRNNNRLLSGAIVGVAVLVGAILFN